jgi:para-nitrobenzyl esterase
MDGVGGNTPLEQRRIHSAVQPSIPILLWLTMNVITPYGADMDNVVTVAGGRVRGVWRGDMWSFSGIPYARSPEGELRWRPPQPPDPWAEVRDASSFGPISPQPMAVAGVTSPSDPDNSEPQSEDCLSLNVWTPELPAHPTVEPGRGRPVMVWIHGGGFTTGSGSVFLYRGGDLVRNGDAVVVTINYRLGALGFLGHWNVMDDDGHIGNWGLFDQMAALHWVKEHIAQFGGDPGNVTIFGESAGGFSVSALMGAPSARGLFRRAIVQSGGVHVHSVEEAERAAGRLANVLGIAAIDREVLLQVPAAELVAATTEVAKHRPDAGLIPLPFLPVVDGALLPLHPLQAMIQGSAADVDLMIGTNRDELTLFGMGNPALMALDEAGVERWVANGAPDVPTAELLATYRESRSARGEGTKARDMWVSIGTDNVFRWPSLQMAAAQHANGASTFVYLFDWESPAFGGVLGSCHGLELPFVFGAVRVPAVQLISGRGPEVEALSAHMQAAWLAFSRTGSPSRPGTLEWPMWDPQTRHTMMFGPTTGAVEAPRDPELAVWSRYRPLATTVSGRG